MWNYNFVASLTILNTLKFLLLIVLFHFLVYQKVLETAASVVNPCNVPLGTLLQFVSAIPREFTDHDGERETIYIWKVNGRSSSNIICFLLCQVYCAK